MTKTTITDAQVPEVLDALDHWIRQRSGLDSSDWWEPGYADAATVRAFRAEQRWITKQYRPAMDALADAWGIPASGAALMGAFRGDRLEWDGSKLTYCTGQYFPTEYRPAAERVLTRYCHAAVYEVTRCQNTRPD